MNLGLVGALIESPLGNQLTNGSIIDICGMEFLFQNPSHMAATSKLKV
jgi:hypothetical protein